MREGLRDVRVVEADVPLRQCVNQLLIHAVGGAQMKFALAIVKDVDRAGLGAGELHCLGDDSGEYGFKVERRVHCLGHFTERAQLADRAAKLIGALSQLVEQPRIFYGDDGLAGEILHQSDLLVGEGTNFLAVNGEGADQFVLLQHRYDEKRPHAGKFDAVNDPRILHHPITYSISMLCSYIGDMNQRFGRDHATGRSCRIRTVR